jgi:hypothetical protein
MLKQFYTFRFLTICCLVSIIMSCKTMHSTPNQTQNGEIHNKEDLNANTVQPGQIFGTYLWIAPQKEAQFEVETPPANCQAAIRLEDGTMIFLQPTWELAAVRPAEELTGYRDKEVVVTGTVLQESPAPPDNRAYVKGPCLTGPISITDRSTWDALHGGKIDW